MSKYLHIIKITFEEYFEYRLNFLLWRFRSLISFLTLLFFWLAIYTDKSLLFDYQKSQMIAYVVGVAFLKSVVLATRSADLSGMIRSGELTKYLIQPIKVFNFWLARDLADKIMNIFFTVIEIILVSRILNLGLFLPRDFPTYFFFTITVLLSLFLYFFLSISLSLTGFWTEDVWATRWLFGVIFLEFFAGAFFPIDVLPSWLAKLIYFTPFPYLVFFPLKIFLGQIPLYIAIRSLLIYLFWLVVFYSLAMILWKKGTKNYGAYGG